MGKQKALNPEDLWDLPYTDEASSVSQVFARAAVLSCRKGEILSAMICCTQKLCTCSHLHAQRCEHVQGLFVAGCI